MPAGTCHPCQLRRWSDQTRIVGLPAILVLFGDLSERRRKCPFGCRDGVGSGRPEPERKTEAAAARKVYVRRLHEIAIVSLSIGRTQSVRGVQLGQAVARLTSETVTYLSERR